jgi:hypothetical protein
LFYSVVSVCFREGLSNREGGLGKVDPGGVPW